MSTYWSDMRAPPQIGENDPAMLIPTIQGYSLTSDSSPLMIFELLVGSPHLHPAAIPGATDGGGVVGARVVTPVDSGQAGLQ